MMHRTPIGRRSGNQHLHHKSEKYREMARSKMAAYHRYGYVQLGCTAQGLLQYLSVRFGSHVWKHFNSGLRTMDPESIAIGNGGRSSPAFKPPASSPRRNGGVVRETARGLAIFVWRTQVPKGALTLIGQGRSRGGTDIAALQG
jgi:hypothetical protein